MKTKCMSEWRNAGERRRKTDGKDLIVDTSGKEQEIIEIKRAGE